MLGSREIHRHLQLWKLTGTQEVPLPQKEMFLFYMGDGALEQESPSLETVKTHLDVFLCLGGPALKGRWT